MRAPFNGPSAAGRPSMNPDATPLPRFVRQGPVPEHPLRPRIGRATLADFRATMDRTL